ncbi:N-acetyltransferase ESCO2-like [Liolophura sinensis]|uniref:N-acetyltransferase ESCO2-like n=1 Tax=Liolophura sinensis TaxID=3198878 RepID=UPI0031581E28
MQLTKMATGITPSKRKKNVPLSSVLDMLENSPSKRPRLSEPDVPKEKPPEQSKPSMTPIRRSLVSAKRDNDEDEDSPVFEIRSFYNPTRHPYLSPIQRRDKGLASQASPRINLQLSKSVVPKITGENSSGVKINAARRLKTKSKRNRFPLKERSSSNLQKTKEKNESVGKVAKPLVKDALVFHLGIKSSSPVLAKPAQGDPYAVVDEFDQPLTWDVEKNSNRFFKGRSLPDIDKAQNEKSTTLVVKQGFSWKFVHHRAGDMPSKGSADKGKKLWMSAKTRTTAAQKNLALNSSRNRNNDDDAMMRKLREELMNESKRDNVFEFASSSDENSTPVSVKENKVSDSIGSAAEQTPDLFSQSPKPLMPLNQFVKKANTLLVPDVKNKQQEAVGKVETDSPLVDSACHSDNTNSADLFEDGSSSGRNSPSVSSDISVCLSELSESTSSSGKSGPTLRGGLKPPSDDQKYFPIFTRSSAPGRPKVTKIFKPCDSPTQRSSHSPVNSPGLNKLKKGKDNSDQLVIDAGQSKLGAAQCDVCCMVYTVGESADEAMHAKFHQNLITALRFPGWKKERVLQDYDDDGGRVLMVLPGDPKYAMRKVEDINQIMAQELGFSDTMISSHPSYKVFLYISDEKRVVGCCVAEPISQGYRVILDSQPGSASSQPGHRPWCSETTPSPAMVGISRIWVYSQKRRQGVATKLLECVRHWFEYGVIISKDMMAFSDPTPDGRQLGARYTGKESFLVYKYLGN